jgi:hypothetical protein
MSLARARGLYDVSAFPCIQKNIVTHQTAMIHFSNKVLMQNAEWPRRGWVRAYAWILQEVTHVEQNVKVTRQSMCRVTLPPM